MQVPTFHINKQSKDIISNAINQLFSKLFTLSKSSKNSLILLEGGVWPTIYKKNFVHNNLLFVIADIFL